MRARGLGRVYQPTYTYIDKRTGQKQKKTAATWWIQYSFRGKVYREPATSTNRVIAVTLLKRRLAEMGQGRLIGPDVERTTFEDLARMLLADYQVNGRKSFRTAENSLKALRAFFGPSYARDITLDRLNAYVTARLETKRKPATIRNELAALKRAFHLAERAGKAICPPFPTLHVSNTRTGFFEEADAQAVLAHLPEAVQPVVEFASLTGWRIGEILPLQWRQVDFGAGTVRLEPGTTKNDEGRVFPFAALPELEALLRGQRARTEVLQRATEQLIPRVFHRDGEPIRDFRSAWQRACKAAGLPGKLVHDFRRTAVRNLERAGVSRSVAMKLTGHRTEAVYRRYAIVAEADLAEGVKKLAALRQAQPEKEAAGPVVIPLSARSGKVLAKS